MLDKLVYKDLKRREKIIKEKVNHLIGVYFSDYILALDDIAKLKKENEDLKNNRPNKE